MATEEDVAAMRAESACFRADLLPDGRLIAIVWLIGGRGRITIGRDAIGYEDSF